MPRNSKRVPTLIDWYLKDVHGNLFGKEKHEGKIKKSGCLGYPSHELEIVGKVFFEGDIKEDCRPYHARALLVQCIGRGKFLVITDIDGEFILSREHLLTDEELDKLLV